MKVYVAGSSSERVVVAEVIEQLEVAGIAVTYDWTKSPGWERPLSTEEKIEQAQRDLDAVAEADVLWLRLGEKSEGAHVELGYALAFGKLVIVSGSVTPERIFPLLADRCFTTHDAAFQAIRLWNSTRNP